MKTSELTGAALDWAVCEATGMFKAYTQFRSGKNFLKVYGVARNKHLHPSTNWQQGGPIIEREKFTVMYDDDWKYDPTDPEDNGERWMADNGDIYYNPTQYGATPLIAAMRFYVASKLGDTVDVPEELNND